MSEMVRCGSCRGAKLVPKLGGIYGDCNSCDGSGKIKISDLIRPDVRIVESSIKELIGVTATCIPVSIADAKPVDLPLTQHDTKARKVYKRKQA